MGETEKIKYEIDPHNRLIVTKSGKRSNLPKFRKILDGRIKTDNNTLTYHIIKSPDSALPRQIRFSGKWSLDKENNLVLTLDKQHKMYAGDKLTVRGEIISAEANKLVFSVATKTVSDQTRIYILELIGRWRADRYNQLSFNVKKNNGRNDELILTGKWDVGKRNQIIYTYAKTQLKKKRKIINTVTLKGYWDITAKHRISYVLNKKINSRLDLKVSLGKPLKRGLQYEIGIGSVPSKKKITLSGEWKINRKIGVLLEMPYENGKLKSIVFGASCEPGDGSGIYLRLRNALGKDLGMEGKFSKKIFKEQGEIFLRGSMSGKEKQILFGAGWIW